MVKIDIHHYDRRIVGALRRIRTYDHPDANKRIIMEFYEFLIAEGLSKGRISKYLYHLFKISIWLGKSYRKADKSDIIRVVQTIERQDYTAHTKHDYKIILKRFYQWLRNTKGYPEEVEWIKTTIKKTNRIMPEELLTEEEVKKIINAANNSRNKAMIALLYESGCRIGELLSLRIKHVAFDEFGARITLDGKTGMRKVRVVSSVPYLSTWLEYHPFKENVNSALWVSVSNHKRTGPVHYPNFKNILRKLGKLAGIKKRVNPHAFRHSRATHLANHLTEAQMNNYFGWVHGSKMAATYVHMSGRDMDEAILRINGVKNTQIEKKQDFAPRKCFRCDKINPPTGRFCQCCGAPLNNTIAMAVEQKKTEEEYFLALLLKDPKIKNALMNKLKIINNSQAMIPTNSSKIKIS